MSHDADRVPLREAIAALREELRAAAEQAQALDPSERYRITEAEIELTVVAENAAGGEAEIGWWVFKAKAQETIKEANTHKVRIRLDVGKIEVD